MLLMRREGEQESWKWKMKERTLVKTERDLKKFRKTVIIY